ncbi:MULTISPECIES: winged helix-turn-helix transcriptional regulator [unclassified Micromonospora]|uniref:winged helix-turn-helix transcriptional regulator n=1 Tax=unclassified Micromonospora TaxID=2617518 RepID=UPI00362F969B
MTSDLDHLLNLAKRKLSVAVLTALHEGPLRYSKLHHAVSQVSSDVVHARTLTDTLTYLRAHDLVEHHQGDDGADYRLTDGGAELLDLLGEIDRWSRQHRTSGGQT